MLVINKQTPLDVSINLIHRRASHAYSTYRANIRQTCTPYHIPCKAFSCGQKARKVFTQLQCSQGFVALSSFFCPLFLLFIPIPVRRKASLLGTALTLRTEIERLRSSSHSEASGSLPFPHTPCLQYKTYGKKWRTKRTATYTEIVANTGCVGLSQVHRDCSNIHCRG